MCRASASRYVDKSWIGCCAPQTDVLLLLLSLKQVRLLVDITERLCDIAVEQNDANLKDVIINKLTQTFTQCFSERLQTVYSKADEAVSLLDAHGPTSESGNAAVRPIS